jgi:FKBP-type peptidyl-prolyl cis-trans isomerase
LAIGKSGDEVSLDYTETLEDGKEFDTSAGKEPLQFMIGAGQMLKGFEQGIIGMEEGTEKEIVIPALEGYDMGELA